MYTNSNFTSILKYYDTGLSARKVPDLSARKVPGLSVRKVPGLSARKVPNIFTITIIVIASVIK